MSELPDFSSSPVGYQPPQQTGRTTSVLMMVLLAIVVCACVIPFCLIILLALLGPAIGNIFSEITMGLFLLPIVSSTL